MPLCSSSCYLLAKCAAVDAKAVSLSTRARVDKKKAAASPGGSLPHLGLPPRPRPLLRAVAEKRFVPRPSLRAHALLLLGAGRGAAGGGWQPSTARAPCRAARAPATRRRKVFVVVVAAALAALASGSALRVNRALAHEEQEVLDADSEFGPVPPGQPGQPGGPPQLPGTTVKQAAAAVSPCGAMDKIGAACKKDRDTCSPDGGKNVFVCTTQTLDCVDDKPKWIGAQVFDAAIKAGKSQKCTKQAVAQGADAQPGQVHSGGTPPNQPPPPRAA